MMMWKILLSLLVIGSAVSAIKIRRQKRSAPISCYKGTKISGSFNSGKLALAQCPEDSACTNAIVDMGWFSPVISIHTGYCVPAHNCSNINCEFVKAQIPSTIPLRVLDCQVACCYTSKCNDPTKPLVSGTRPVTTAATTTVATTTTPTTSINCQSHVPSWTGERMENWPDQRSSKPMFQLTMKKITRDGRYKANKAYKMVFHMHKKNRLVKIAGAYVVLRHMDGDCECGENSCELGSFIESQLATLPSGCGQPLVMRRTSERPEKKVSTKWRAPSCGNIIMSVVVKGSDGKIYSDNNQNQPKRKLLTQSLRLSA